MLKLRSFQICISQSNIYAIFNFLSFNFRHFFTFISYSQICNNLHFFVFIYPFYTFFGLRSRSLRSLKIFDGVGVFLSPGVGVLKLFSLESESESESYECAGVGVFFSPGVGVLNYFSWSRSLFLSRSRSRSLKIIFLESESESFFFARSRSLNFFIRLHSPGLSTRR